MMNFKDWAANIGTLLGAPVYAAGVLAVALWGMCHYAPYSAMGKWLVLQIFLQ